MAHQDIDLRASIARVAAGGIPTRAEERLAEEAGPNRKLFTSDLSVSAFLLARDAGCEPIAQVMGSSIFHVGQIPDYKGKTSEIMVISDAHRESRRAALSRLFQEAQLVGADAVIGVQLRDRMITMGSRGKGGDDAVRDVAGVKLLARAVTGVEMKYLKSLVDEAKGQVGRGIVCIIGISEDGKAGAVVGVTADLTGRFNAVDLVRIASEQLGGKGGGGRPDMAQAGGPDGSKAEAALEAVIAAIGSKAAAE